MDILKSVLMVMSEVLCAQCVAAAATYRDATCLSPLPFLSAQRFKDFGRVLVNNLSVY